MRRMEYTVHGSIKNLFDKEYYAGGSGDEVYPSPPRTFLAGASVSF